MPARRRAYGGAKASAIDVETPGHIEDEGGEKDEQKNSRDQNRSGQPDAEDQRKTHQQFEPREKERRKVDQQVRKNLIIVDDLRERDRVEDFIVARIDKDPPQEQAGEKKGDASPSSLRASIGCQEGLFFLQWSPASFWVSPRDYLLRDRAAL
jgi:hypothetical protein